MNITNVIFVRALIMLFFISNSLLNAPVLAMELISYKEQSKKNRREIPSLKELAAQKILTHAYDISLLKISSELKEYLHDLVITKLAKEYRNDTDLFGVVKNGFCMAIPILAEKGVDINQREKRRWGNTPLISAIKKRNLAMVEQLIRFGANINALNDHGTTPLIVAADLKQYRIAKHLIKNGACVDQNDMSGITPLLCAADHGYEEIGRLLLEKGADPNKSDNGNVTPLMCAARSGSTHLTHLLIKYGARINKQDKRGMTALMYAGNFLQPLVWEILLDNKAKRSLKNKHGDTAHDIYQRAIIRKFVSRHLY